MNGRSNFNCINLFTVLLQVLFIGLKLTNQIDWSWFMVFSPIWVPLIIITLISIAIYLLAVKTHRINIRRVRNYDRN